MNYELVKQLKDAGFPQSEDWFNGRESGYSTDCMITKCAGGEMSVPNLSELIEECGDDGIFLWKYNKVWCAKAVDPVYHCFTDEYIDDKFSPQKGSTPEEAVAKLWLELNNNY